MSFILGAVITAVIVVYVANMLGRQWRLRDEELARERRLQEIKDHKERLLREHAALLAEEATLVTYSAANVPDSIRQEIEQSMPCPVTDSKHYWRLDMENEVATAAGVVRVDRIWVCTACDKASATGPGNINERTRP